MLRGRQHHVVERSMERRLCATIKSTTTKTTTCYRGGCSESGFVVVDFSSSSRPPACASGHLPLRPVLLRRKCSTQPLLGGLSNELLSSGAVIRMRRQQQRKPTTTETQHFQRKPRISIVNNRQLENTVLAYLNQQGDTLAYCLADL